MILPNVRASFGRREVDLVLSLLSGDDARRRRGEEERMHDQGFDALLDDPRTFNALMTTGGVGTAPPRLAFYLLVRHALLEGGIDDRELADYITALLADFGRADRAYAIDGDDRRFEYLVDIVHAMDAADGRREFLLHVHLGDFALWLSGLFPDHITARVDRRGAPGIEYYEELGATGYRRAADSRDAADHGLQSVYRSCADTFRTLRVALNRISDRYFFPTTGDPVDRLLRQVADRFRGSGEPN